MYEKKLSELREYKNGLYHVLANHRFAINGGLFDYEYTKLISIDELKVCGELAKTDFKISLLRIKKKIMEVLT